MERTFHTLECWSKCLFEKLGWMILATHEQNLNKVIKKFYNFIIIYYKN